MKEMKIFMRPNKEPLTNFAKYVNKIESKVGNFDDFIKKQLKSNKLTEEQKNTLNTATNIAEISKLLAMSQPQTITDDDKLNTYINKLQNAIKEVLKNTTVPLLPEIINKLQNINVPSKQSNMFLLVMANQVLPQAKENELHNFFNNIPDDQKHSLYQQLNTEYSKINKTSLTETQGFKDLKYHNPILYNKIIGKT
ncbi:MAG TPA: hypothetical protein P5241_00980 [Candidatus Paceibacterota bacterium]|nr:hypothetical protein [Candidatus Paceibacterota bacterium]